MSGICPTAPSGPGFLAGVLRAMDCLSARAAEQSFAFLATPGGLGSALLVTATTLLIVIIGFRLMFNQAPTFGDVTASAVKVGIALAIATSWPVVGRVIAEPVINGPAEITRWTGITDGLAERLGRADEGIGALTSWGTGRNDLRAQRTASGDYAANESATVVLTDALAFGGGRTAFLAGTIGSLGLLKLLSGILVGFAPLFAGFLLFARTQGIFGGWARTLLGLLVAGAAANILLSVELAILEPWLAQTIADRQASLATPSAASELLALTMAFSLIGIASTILIIRAMVSLDFAPLRVRSAPVDQRSDRQTHRETSWQEQHSLLQERASSSRSAHTIEGLARIDSFREVMRQSGSGGGNRDSRAGDDRRVEQRPGSRTGRQPRRTLVAQRRDRRI